MKWQMNENSLFAILLRSSWWVSFAIAAALTAVAVALLPEPYRLFGAVTGLPFFVIGCIAAWRQFQAPSTARIDKTVAAVRAMSWVEFSRAIEAAYRRDGYDVTAVSAPPPISGSGRNGASRSSAASAGRRRARASSRCRTSTRRRRRTTRRSASTWPPASSPTTRAPLPASMRSGWWMVPSSRGCCPMPGAARRAT